MRSTLLSITAVLALSVTGACDKAPAPPAPAPSVAPTPPPKPAPVVLRASRPAPPRLVAIGDLHGDLDAARRVLRLAGATDAKDAWIGGKLVVVQTGDAIDRGDDDRAILDLLERLKGEAAKAGGELIALCGNHEIMNAQFDFRYVTQPAFTKFGDVHAKNAESAAVLEKLDSTTRGRAAAFAPGGPYATMLANRPIVYRVGDTMFAHGGVLPKHVTAGIDRINDETKAWLLGEQPSPPRAAIAEDGPLWTRMYSAAPGREECATLNEALGMLGAKRMVMGHTVQRNGINPACEGKAWRIDVGMSKFFSGPIQALAIEGDTVTVLKEGG